ncbi:inositol monophosphatase [Patescibacteria group bacterium]|nr:inositol monophosphatase [Patescibacteria group bacterium]
MDLKFLEIAKKAGLLAGGKILKYYGKKLKTFGKGESSDFATQADLDAETIIIKTISESFPDHNIVSEEKGQIQKGSNYTWVIDPLDGTFTFSHNLPYFSTSISLLDSGKPILGVINHIVAKKLYWAVDKKGAFMNGKRIRVGKYPDLDSSAFCLGFGHRGKRQDRNEAYIKLLVNKVGYPYSFGSSVTTLAMVAAGELDGYVAQAWPWDFAAGAVIIKEAGGIVTDFKGDKIDLTKQKQRLDLVASNKLLHSQIIKVLQK